MAWHVEQSFDDSVEETREAKTTELAYKVYCDPPQMATAVEARAAFLDAVDATAIRDVFGNRSATFRCEGEGGSAGRVFNVTLSFAPDEVNENPLMQENAWWAESFDTTGGTSHVTRGWNERRYLCDDEHNIPDMFCGLSWNGTEFAGTEIITPALSISIKQRHEYWPYLNHGIVALAEATGTVNADVFMGFAAGNVLLTGANGSTVFEYEGEIRVIDNELREVPTPYWDVTYQFRCQPTRTITINNVAVTKAGWEYFWVLETTVDDEESGLTYNIPQGVYVNRVYPETSFCALFGFWG